MKNLLCLHPSNEYAQSSQHQIILKTEAGYECSDDLYRMHADSTATIPNEDYAQEAYTILQPPVKVPLLRLQKDL